MMINLKKVWNDNPFDQWTEEELLCMEGQGICYGKGGGSAPPPPASADACRIAGTSRRAMRAARCRPVLACLRGGKDRSEG